MGSKIGVLKIAAKKVGLTLDEYMAHIEVGEKWCYKGEHWKPLTDFAFERARGDEHKPICRVCDYVPTTQKPGRRERQQKRLEGLAYCSKCEDWLPVADVYRGLCRTHINEDARERYSNNPRYKSERKQHAHARKRNVKPIPPIGQENILEEFGGKCAYCPNAATTWDHINPVIKGGMTLPFNIVPACVSCNSSKCDRDVMEWISATGKTLSTTFVDRIILEEYYFPR